MANAKGSGRKRPYVIGVTINLLFPDGNCRTVTIDPSRAEGVFWSDRAVLKMLAPFYGTITKMVTREQLDKRFGNLDGIFRGADEIQITPEVIEQLWQLENEEGTLPGILSKTVDCIPRPEPCMKCIF